MWLLYELENLIWLSGIINILNSICYVNDATTACLISVCMAIFSYFLLAFMYIKEK